MRNNFLLIGLGVLAVFGIFFRQNISAGVYAVSDSDKWSKYDNLFKKYAVQFKVPWRWLKAIAIVESSLGDAASVKRGLENPNDVQGSTSGDGKSWGLMQVTLPTAKGLEGRTVGVAELNNPDFSVYLAAKLVRQLINTFGLDKEKVSRAYNGGPKYGALTLPYWAKFQTALATVMAKHPGNETEY